MTTDTQRHRGLQTPHAPLHPWEGQCVWYIKFGALQLACTPDVSKRPQNKSKSWQENFALFAFTNKQYKTTFLAMYLGWWCCKTSRSILNSCICVRNAVKIILFNHFIHCYEQLFVAGCGLLNSTVNTARYALSRVQKLFLSHKLIMLIQWIMTSNSLFIAGFGLFHQ